MIKKLTGLFFGLIVSTSSLLAQEAPDAMVKNITEEVLSIVREDKDIQGGNTQKAIALVEEKVLPSFDFKRMTALALGREWNKANPAQKDRLTEEFKTLLVRTYSNALTSYKDQSIRYRPLKMADSDTEVLVRTEIVQPGNRPIQLDYSLHKPESTWKVYDVVVAGVSLVTNYRDTFTQEIRANGVDGLIQMLESKNKQLDPANK